MAFVCVQSGIHIRPSVDVQVVEFIPKPHGLVVLVQIDQHVSRYRSSGDDLLCTGNHDEVPVGKHHEVVMRPYYRDIASISRTCCSR